MNSFQKGLIQGAFAGLIIFGIIFAYTLYLSKIAEHRCIEGARKESRAGKVSQEIKNWCVNTF